MNGVGRGGVSWVCLYTKHKTRKSKVWQDGVAVVTGDKVVLHAVEADKVAGVVESCFLPSKAGWREGDEVELENHLVQIESCLGSTDGPALAAPPPLAAKVAVVEERVATPRLVPAAGAPAPARRRPMLSRIPSGPGAPSASTPTPISAVAMAMGVTANGTASMPPSVPPLPPQALAHPPRPAWTSIQPRGSAHSAPTATASTTPAGRPDDDASLFDALFADQPPRLPSLPAPPVHPPSHPIPGALPPAPPTVVDDAGAPVVQRGSGNSNGGGSGAVGGRHQPGTPPGAAAASPPPTSSPFASMAAALCATPNITPPRHPAATGGGWSATGAPAPPTSTWAAAAFRLHSPQSMPPSPATSAAESHALPPRVPHAPLATAPTATWTVAGGGSMSKPAPSALVPAPHLAGIMLPPPHVFHPAVLPGMGGCAEGQTCSTCHGPCITTPSSPAPALPASTAAPACRKLPVGWGRRGREGGTLAWVCGSCWWQRTHLSRQYASPSTYVERMVCATVQEIVIALSDPVSRWWKCAGAACGLLVQPASSPATGPVTPAALQSRCRAVGVGLYASADLILMAGKKAGSGEGGSNGVGAKRKRVGGGRRGMGDWRRRRTGRDGTDVGKDDDDDDDGGSEEEEERRGCGVGAPRLPAAPDTLAGWMVAGGSEAGGEGGDVGPRLFLRFAPADRERPGVYGIDDVWLISTQVDWGLGSACPPAIAAMPCPPPPTTSAAMACGDGTSSSGGDAFWRPITARVPFTFFARARFHGPSTRNMMEVTPLAPGLQRYGTSSLAFQPLMHALSALPPMAGTRCVRVCALRLCNASTELACLDTLAALAAAPPTACPLLPALASGGAGITGPACAVVEGGSTSPMRHVVEDVIAHHGLNKQQGAVVRACAAWFHPPAMHGGSTDGGQGEGEGWATSPTPFIACHGCFGSGKSHMIVALTTALARAGAVSPGRHLLIAAATNTAVDRVLCGLLDAGFHDFARVGAVKKVHKRLLPYLLPYSDRAEAVASTLADLREVLAIARAPSSTMVAGRAPGGSWGGDGGGGDGGGHGGNDESDGSVAAILEAIRRMEAERDQLARLKRATVVGVTCAATNFPILSTLRCAVVVLDEASQMVEPVSLLPVTKFGAMACLAVGDLKQLPPILPRPPASPPPTKPASTRPTLDTLTLFDRLAQQGCTQVHLTVQYRCHPALASLASRLFYAGTVTSGVAPGDRPPLVPGWPPLALVDTGHGGEEVVDRGGGEVGSTYNLAEVGAVMQVMDHVLRAGVAPGGIGIVCLYRAQMYKVADAVRQRGVRAVLGGGGSDGGGSATAAVAVCTVDAFQGAEKAVIIVSPCRTVPWRAGGGGAEFLCDPRRMNVTLTRARNHCIVVGCTTALRTYPLWSDVVAAGWTVTVPQAGAGSRA